MYVPEVKKLLEEAKKNKEKRKSSQSGGEYFIPQPDKAYPTLFINAEYKGEEIWVCRSIFKNRSIFSRKIEKFKINGGNSFIYDDICAALGTDGNPADLIEKFAVCHIERNGNFQNLKVDAEIEEDEFWEMLDNLGENKSRKKKKTGRKKPASIKAAGKAAARKAKKKPADFDEYEDMDSDSDYEEAYDGDDYDGEYDDRNAEQDYLDDMADFQG